MINFVNKFIKKVLWNFSNFIEITVSIKHIIIYYQVPYNSVGWNNSIGWTNDWILIIALAGLIVLGEQKRLIFKNSVGWNNSIGWKNV